jgi:3-oxoacyl-[acyl-carrier protein] reductase
VTIFGSALVTGASRGLGPHLARRLASDGWPVAVNFRSDPAGAERVVEEIRRLGGRAAAFRADVTDEADVRALVAAVSSELGDVQVLVVNATGPQPEVPAEETTWRQHLDQLEFFVKSPTLLMQATIAGMRRFGSGRIIHIGSDMFERGLPGFSAYNAAKGAQIGLARTWARELGPSGVTTNIVAPGWIPVERHGEITDENSGGYRDEIPLRRMGTPAEIADVVAFVASDAARFVNGERITVNGGHTID